MRKNRVHGFAVANTPGLPAFLGPNVSIQLADTDCGLLPNRLTTAQRDGIPVPAIALTIYNTDKHLYEYWNGTSWVALEVIADEVAATRQRFTQTQSVTVANTTNELPLSGTGIGSLTVPADFLTVGKTITLAGYGYHSASGNPDIRIRFYVGSTVVLDTGNVSSGNSSDAVWFLRGLLTVLSVGASGSLIGQGNYIESAGGENLFGMVNTTPVSIDTTVSNTLQLTVEWGSGSGASITMTNFLVEIA